MTDPRHPRWIPSPRPSASAAAASWWAPEHHRLRCTAMPSAGRTASSRISMPVRPLVECRHGGQHQRSRSPAHSGPPRTRQVRSSSSPTASCTSLRSQRPFCRTPAAAPPSSPAPSAPSAWWWARDSTPATNRARSGRGSGSPASRPSCRPLVPRPGLDTHAGALGVNRAGSIVGFSARGGWDARGDVAAPIASIGRTPMRPVPILLLLGSPVASSNGRATAQAPRLTPAITARTAGPLNPDRWAVAIPDSVRVKVGYQHWKGGAIGAAVGALAGLMLGLAAAHTCADCGSRDSPALIGSLAGSRPGWIVRLSGRGRHSQVPMGAA